MMMTHGLLLAQLKCVAKFVLQLALGDANLLHRWGGLEMVATGWDLEVVFLLVL